MTLNTSEGANLYILALDNILVNILKNYILFLMILNQCEWEAYVDITG